MKNFFFVFVFFIAANVVFPQKNDTLVVSSWGNGADREVKVILENGSYRILKYFADGSLQCEVNYNLKGQLDGPEKCWFESGKPKQEGYWSNGINTGAVILWYSSGQKSFEGWYLENGTPHGSWKGWYENGQIQYEQGFSEGLKNGKLVTYNKDGGVELIQYFEKGTQLKEQGR